MGESWNARKDSDIRTLAADLENERQQVKSLNSELRPLKRNLNEAWRELQRKEKLEMERKNATEQMLAMKSAFEVLHTNLSRSCETIGTSAGEETEGTKDTITPRGRTNGHS